MRGMRVLVTGDGRWRLEVRARGVDVYDRGAQSARRTRVGALVLRQADLDRAVRYLLDQGADIDTLYER
ncbi:hypothetical protein Daura_38535 [Dactylosporangium aurantiacum]|uniref:Uncharacterized protein n=1 Tax=Dactylosporangium aurantiacum TaxID=35754 RepID=A0A9Q9I9T1_9ACTN|nr:hypothetical protein [Dactylosporangium aurantiacum]MDG6101680.1 hypothetical protein [Dactylosporangium aurantiacum]UWZ52499.1 hypothetical protein Daura_38535 [Dactylosporangium aurantiacum]